MNGNGVVLIVDDHASLARSLVSLLSASGFDAQAVHSGAEALAFVRSHAAVALILLDMSMPDMSGVEVLRALRVPGGGHAHSPPVVMFSVGRRSGDPRRGHPTRRYRLRLQDQPGRAAARRRGICPPDQTPKRVNTCIPSPARRLFPLAGNRTTFSRQGGNKAMTISARQDVYYEFEFRERRNRQECRVPR